MAQRVAVEARGTRKFHVVGTSGDGVEVDGVGTWEPEFGAYNVDGVLMFTQSADFDVLQEI